MKTVTIDRYHVWGTKGTYAIGLLYRGIYLVHLGDDMLAALLNAKGRAFTHFKEKGSKEVKPL